MFEYVGINFVILESIYKLFIHYTVKHRAMIAQWYTSWMIGFLGFDSRRGLGIFLFITAYRPALEPTQPPIQCVLGALSLGVKRLGREADHSPPSSAEISPIHLHGVVLT
jgi:hypothetical protein